MFQGLPSTLVPEPIDTGRRREVDVLKETAARLAEAIFAAAASNPCQRTLDAVRVASAAICLARVEEEGYLLGVVGPKLRAADRAVRDAAVSAAAERRLASSGAVRLGFRAQREAGRLDRAEARERARHADAAISRGPVEALRTLVETLSSMPT
jgi:hypothetical protein